MKPMKTDYISRDNFGMYAHTDAGPGPALMGADTLLGNEPPRLSERPVHLREHRVLQLATLGETSPASYHDHES
jgi:hypothetical protein